MRHKRGSTNPYHIAGIVIGACFLAMITAPTAAGSRLAAEAQALDTAHLGWLGFSRQSYELTCGHSLISTLTILTGQGTTEKEILDLTAGPNHALTLADFGDIATQLGSPGRWMMNARRSKSLPSLPAVIHLNSPVNHYIYVAASRSNYAITVDPSEGTTVSRISNLLQRFSGYYYAFNN